MSTDFCNDNQNLVVIGVSFYQILETLSILSVNDSCDKIILGSKYVDFFRNEPWLISC